MKMPEFKKEVKQQKELERIWAKYARGIEKMKSPFHKIELPSWYFEVYVPKCDSAIKYIQWTCGYDI